MGDQRAPKLANAESCRSGLRFRARFSDRIAEGSAPVKKALLATLVAVGSVLPPIVCRRRQSSNSLK